MKPILLLLCTAFLLSCNYEPKAEPSNDLDLKGTWKMISYLNYSVDGSVDTIMTSENFIQMKMFSEKKFMWNRFTSYDTAEWFGSGNYTFKNDTLAEHTEYGSEALLSVLEKDSIHRLSIDFINEDSYMQTEKDSLGNPIYGEIYRRIK
ncbi:hypothetical protein [Aestuariibaculum sediminum]|uniref:Lipocalin-like domain-containing protein n=1 Tax=Aestuariibaculum sediminum TaxID=2770637 RepID=A0A8J6Q477_9FLAO|nr:hypothetical protein [Aestuariibaculum sediminum]MBD0833215.1 hypothetical protein [Aestuariibaculum sediminum]